MCGISPPPPADGGSVCDSHCQLVQAAGGRHVAEGRGRDVGGGGAGVARHTEGVGATQLADEEVDVVSRRRRDPDWGLQTPLHLYRKI